MAAAIKPSRLRFASIGSGSRGNGTLVEKGRSCVLVDCGFSVVQVRQRLARLGRQLDDLTAILVTHEHSDHLRGVGPLARECRIPVWMTAGTAAQADATTIPNLKLFNSHQDFEIGDLQVSPYPVPHDAREPSQFVFSDGAVRLGLLTDVGCITPHIEASLDGCEALLLECNHDTAMLAGSSYPYSVKERIGSRHGHLNNDQAAELLTRIDCTRLQHLVAAHLSDQNNTPALARRALSSALDCDPEWIAIAGQDDGISWCELA